MISSRFYTALALQELINESPMNIVAAKYKFNRGTLQSLQQTASTFAGIVKSFCIALNWNMLALIVSQFKDRIFFGVHQDLIEIMKIPVLSGKQRMARVLFDAGYRTLGDLSTANVIAIEKSLSDSLSFDVETRDGESNFDAAQRNKSRLLFALGKQGLTISETAKIVIDEARYYLQQEMGVRNIVWNTQNSPSNVMETSNQNTPVKTLHGNNQIATTSTTPSLANAKRKLSDGLNRECSTSKRSKIASEQINGIPSEASSSEVSDEEVVDLNESTTIYNDDHDNFLQKFQYLFEPSQNRRECSTTLRIVDITETERSFDDFIDKLSSVNECAMELAVCKRTQENRLHFIRCTISSDYILFGIAFCIGREFTVYFLNLQNDAPVSVDKRIELVQSILHRKYFTLQINQAKRQLKTITKALSNDTNIQCGISDPEIANWLLHPDMDGTFEQMVCISI